VHVDPRPPPIAQLLVQPDVVVGDAFVDIQLLHQCWIDAINLAVDGLIAEPKHRIALKAAQSHPIKPAIGLALRPCQQMMGRTA